jgi:L-arabinose transport system permease araQ
MRRVKYIGSYLGIIILAIIFVLPLFWILSTSFKNESEIITGGFNLFPSKITFKTYQEILFNNVYSEQVPVLRWFFNSLFVSCIHTILMLVISASSAYAYARLEFKGKNILFYLLLSTMMIPQIVIITPLYKLMIWFNWVNSYQALIFPGLSNVVSVFLLRQFMLGIPNEYDESAKIDGADEFKIFLNIILPLIKPALFVSGLFVFLANWNDFLWPTIVTSSISMRTLPAGLRVVQGYLTTQYGKIAVVSVISALPVFIIYLFVQKYFAKGLYLSSGVKG